MNRGDFEKLYDSIPKPKPGFDEVWRLTGGNPGALSSLYRARWNVDLVVGSLVERRVYRLISSLKMEELEGLRRALDDPDVLYEESLSSLLRKLVEYNMVVDGLYSRDERLWVDAPPPERDPVVGVGRRVAWQTPLHREAVRRALSPGSSK